MTMPLVSMFFGIKIYIYYDDHDPPHFHAEYQGEKAVFDFRGNILNGDLNSRTATRLVREWVDLRCHELKEDWDLAQSGNTLKKIPPLD
jgi:hypothetical protein